MTSFFLIDIFFSIFLFLYIFVSDNKVSLCMHLCPMTIFIKSRLGQKELIMFLTLCPRQLQPPTSNIFNPFPVFTLKNCLYISNCQFKLAIISFTTILFVFGWLVVNQLVAAHTKSWKFLKIIWIHRAVFSKGV